MDGQEPSASRLIVTVDGPGGSGKSTVSRILARRLGLPYLNSGYLYRTVTLLVLESGEDFENRERVEEIIRGMAIRFEEGPRATRVFVGDREVTSRLKDPDVTPLVWKIANDGGYRSLLVEAQRICAEPLGVVAEGRDMGTVIFPHADCKFYLDAAPEVRARRQHRDLESAGHHRSYEDVLREVLERDRHDRDRKDAPLRIPEGAIVIHSDGLTIDDVVESMLGQVVVPRVDASTRMGPGGSA